MNLIDAIQIFSGSNKIMLEVINKKEKRSKNEIGFSSIRGGNIVGEHTIQFYGIDEVLEIKHKAYSRSVFANRCIKIG